MKKMKTDPEDKFEIDYIDLDRLFALYVEQFKKYRVT